MKIAVYFLAIAATIASAGSVPQLVKTDLCVYGGTSGGVVAAVTAKRLGRTVVIIEPTAHLGGLTSGGLGSTDIGNAAAIGGYSDEFYRKVGAKYGKSSAQFTFEPHVAEAIFDEWVEEYKIPVFLESNLVRVEMDGTSITEIETDRGDVFRAEMFLDTTYEGDLMAMAGVSYTIGREANSQYGETLNGVRANTPSHQFEVDVDPYVVPGDPGSGLLPYIQEGDGGIPGEGDVGVQAYNFRLCLTQNVGNQIPITAPPGYDVGNYELLGRYLEARVAAGHSMSLNNFLIINGMPNGKTDINNRGAFSTDFIGQNYDYPDGSPAVRAAIWGDTKNYIKGFLHFMGTDPRVPLNVRIQMQSWGYCADEFQDTGGFGHQMYVREARRMVSDYVMIQQNAEGTRVAPKSIGLGAYKMDSHNVQRIVKNGVVHNEGDVQVGVPEPYGIAYDSIVPARGECDNLFVTFCLSASHIAFGSARMEPVFMITSQSAATAAAFAIDDGVAVQDVDYTKLSGQLYADGQILNWTAGVGDAPEIIVDNLDTGAAVTGAWTTSSATAGYYGSDYLHDGNTGQGTKSVRFTPDLPAAGDYPVFLRWASGGNRATNVPVTVFHSGGSTTLTINQQANGGEWFGLGTWNFDAGTGGSLLIETTGANGYVIADAAGWGFDAAPGLPTVHLVAADPWGTEGDTTDPVRFTIFTEEPVSVPLTVSYTTGGTASSGLDLIAPSGSVTIAISDSAAQIIIHALEDAEVEGDETVTLTLQNSADYQLGTNAAATATLRDEPFDAWRFTEFTPTQLATPGVAGETDDPDEDGNDNLAEFVGGGYALVPDAGPYVMVHTSTGTAVLDLFRMPGASGVTVIPQISSDLDDFTDHTPLGAPEFLLQGDFDQLRYPIELFDPDTHPKRFYRFRFQRTPFVPDADTLIFWSFDTETDGTGDFDPDPAVLSGFSTAPTLVQSGSQISSNGGAGSYIDPQATIWLGSGGPGVPGHSLAWNPGSTGNELTLTIATSGLQDIQLRMDIRSAEAGGGSAPEAFASFTYDIGGGPVAVPGVSLSFTQDNSYNEWTADLSSLDAIENIAQVTLRWTFADLGVTPAESFRLDNLLLEASAIAP